MNLVEIKEAVEREINDRNLSASAHHLKLHQPVYNKGKLQFAAVDKAREGNIVVAYLPVAEQPFYFAVSVNTDAARVISFATEAGYTIFLRATSIVHTAEVLKSFTTLIPSRSWSKGDKNPDSNFDFFFSAITFEDQSGAGLLEDKLDAFLNVLEQDTTGIQKLVADSNVYLQIIAHHSISDDNISSFVWSRDLLKRLVALNLEVNVEQYVKTNKI
jgi:hypothetical protein